MRPDRADSDLACRYVAGLPHCGTRPLAEHDRAWLERRLRRLALGVAAAGLGLVAVIVGALLLPPLPSPLARTLGGGFGVSLLALGSVGLLACLATRGWWRRLALLAVGALAVSLAIEAWLPALALPRWLTAELVVAATVLGLSHLGLHLAHRVRVLWNARRIRADLAEGVLDRYEAPRPRSSLDGLLARLHRAGHVVRRGEALRLEVLPRSGLVVRMGGRRVERWETAHIAHVAPAQPHALRVALPRGVAPAHPDPRLCLRRRSLTPQERAELQRHIDRLRRRWWPAAALTVVVLALVAYDLRTVSPHDALPLGASIGWLALLALAYVGYGRRVLAARKLEHDRRLRWVVTVHQDTDTGRDPPSLEVLPISQLAWTEQATPAGWRSSRL